MNGNAIAAGVFALLFAGLVLVRHGDEGLFEHRASMREIEAVDGLTLLGFLLIVGGIAGAFA